LDFTPLFKIWAAEGDSKMAALQQKQVFEQVVLSETHTLCWPNILVPFVFKGQTRMEPLELDAQELYRQSHLVKKLEDLHVGAMFRQARKKAGLTQSEVALNSGTTSKYISKIENEKSDIQVGTLQKIVELGIGQKMTITIGENQSVVAEKAPEYQTIKRKGKHKKP
jgi:DNA-binding XRE family transcriptional regulator